MRTTLVLLAGLLLAGCTASSTGSSASSSQDFTDLGGEATDTTGLIRGVVVDSTIKPIADASVLISGATKHNISADAQGRFVVDGLEPGTYLVKATHLLYKEAQTTVEVVAGVDEPAITKLQLEATFTSKPFHQQEKFTGYIACGYEAILVTAPCITDYTSILDPCAGGCAPQLREVQGDDRAFATAVDAGWQTIVLEMTFQPISQGTADQMGLLISFAMRTASDWYANAEGDSPVRLRVENGEIHASQAGAFDMVNPEGQPDLELLGSFKSSSGAGVGLEQKFEVYKTDFYNAKPPAEWSFVGGDKFPF